MEKIKVGDKVIILFSSGRYIIGTLTKDCDEEPYCEIDGKGIDLANEGETSSMFKWNNPIPSF